MEVFIKWCFLGDKKIISSINMINSRPYIISEHTLITQVMLPFKSFHKVSFNMSFVSSFSHHNVAFIHQSIGFHPRTELTPRHTQTQPHTSPSNRIKI